MVTDRRRNLRGGSQKVEAYLAGVLELQSEELDDIDLLVRI